MKAEVIKLSENQIEIDGVKYLRQEPEYVRGNWYVAFVQKLKYLIRYESGKTGMIYALCFIPYDSTVSFSLGGAFDYIERPATKEEIESHLIKVAKEKGFKEGCRYNNTVGSTKVAVKDPELYESDNPYSLICGNFDGLIYDNKLNKWAEILPSKKALPKDKEALKSFLRDWMYEAQGISINEFLNQYE